MATFRCCEVCRETKTDALGGWTCLSCIMAAREPLKPAEGLYTVSKTFELAVAHSLRSVPATHKCWRLHGHNLEVTVTVARRHLNRMGFVMDFAILDALFQKEVAEALNHRHLNDVFKSMYHSSDLIPMPTAERLAAWIADRLNSATDHEYCFALATAGWEPELHSEYLDGEESVPRVVRVDVRESRDNVASWHSGAFAAPGGSCTCG